MTIKPVNASNNGLLAKKPDGIKSVVTPIINVVKIKHV